MVIAARGDLLLVSPAGSWPSAVAEHGPLQSPSAQPSSIAQPEREPSQDLGDLLHIFAGQVALLSPVPVHQDLLPGSELRSQAGPAHVTSGR